ncbi:MAG: translation initiation factor IF-2 subunit alpha [archaeon]|nr:translation initiation factor IF-2 subunit alpha [archaeon]MDA0842961.1 translation initiation factor IF-2 subunit alpha [archaeon]
MHETSPEEGEFVIVTVSNVKQNGVYVNLDEYQGREGFIFIGELASGWVKNIRSVVREGQRIVCKVIKAKKDNSAIELSLKSVTEERRRDRLQEWKNEQRAQQLLRFLSEKINMGQDETQELSEQLIDAFGSLYTAFEEAALNEGSLANAGFEGPWIQEFTALAVENIIPPFVELRGTIELQTSSSEGIHIIRDALLKIEEFSDEKKEINVTCHYDGAPNYRIELKAPDFKTAEKVWENSVQAAINFFREHGGQGKAWRE